LEIINRSGLTEFKWYKLRQARDRFAANYLLDQTVKYAVADKLRIDALIWDISDSRHAINKRDDIANLERMYYHLFRNVLKNRWPNGSTWGLFPDEHSAIDWDAIARYLKINSLSITTIPNNLFTSVTSLHTRIIREFSIHHIQQVESHHYSLCQVADLFAGIAAYSRNSIDRYSLWLKHQDQQMSMLLDDTPAFHPTNSESERFRVLKDFIRNCKDRRLGVSLMSSKGLQTYKPTNPINFWFYRPQHDMDKAPIVKL
jgi:hypothetical protein